MNRRHIRGVTLIELLVVTAVLAILLTSVSGAYAALIEKRRLEGAAEAVRSHLQLARSEAIRQMKPMTVTHPDADDPLWRIGLHDDGPCTTALADPALPGACTIFRDTSRVLAVLDGAQYPGVQASASRPTTRFNALNGTSFGTNATVRLRSRSGHELRVIVANVGRVRTCSPAGSAHVAGYAAC